MKREMVRDHRRRAVVWLLGRGTVDALVGCWASAARERDDVGARRHGRRRERTGKDGSLQHSTERKQDVGKKAAAGFPSRREIVLGAQTEPDLLYRRVVDHMATRTGWMACRTGLGPS